MSIWRPKFRGVLGLLLTLCLVEMAGAHEELQHKISEFCEGRLSGETLQKNFGRWNGKTVILDTNVILNDPFSIYKYAGATVVIPGTVLEELDEKKSDLQTGLAARRFSREMDAIMKQGGNLREGVLIGHKSYLRVDTKSRSDLLSASSLDGRKRDNQIIATALAYYLLNDGLDSTVLISDDINVRIKATAEGMLALPSEYDWVTPTKEIVQLYKTHSVSRRDLEHFLKDGFLPLPEGLKIAPNEFVMLQQGNNEGGPETVARYVYDREAPEKSGLRKLRDFSTFFVQPKNLEQHMLLDVLMDPTIDFVIADSSAGTGKSFLALAAGMGQLPNLPDGRYEDMAITRALVHLGKFEFGALPGDKDDKLAEYYNSFYDNFRILLAARTAWKGDGPSTRSRGPNRQDRREGVRRGVEPSRAAHSSKGEKNGAPKASEDPKKPELRLVKDKYKPIKIDGVDLLAFPYIRGRTFHRTFLLLDEAQNTSIHEAKTILTRIGEGSKIIMLGDSEQIDVPYLNERNNGLSVAASLFTNEQMSLEDRSRVAFVKLFETVRSPFSDLAIRQFKQATPQR